MGWTEQLNYFQSVSLPSQMVQTKSEIGSPDVCRWSRISPMQNKAYWTFDESPMKNNIIQYVHDCEYIL